MQRVTIASMRYHTHNHMCYRTFSLSLTWVDQHAMHYHNFNVLAHTIPYIFTQFSMVLGLFATRYRQIYKKMYINIFFINLTITHGNALQIAPKPC